MVGNYEVVTLCGSTKFKDEFIKVQKDFTLAGYIVISVGLFGHSGDNEVWNNDGIKEMLDDMHKRKIDMADKVVVIDVNGYIGESTKNEIEYAKQTGKPILYYSKIYGGDNLQIRANHTDGSIVIENARDRFVNLLNSSNADTFESIVTEYIHKFSNTISADECCQIIQLLSEIQYPKIAKLNNIKRVAREHAGYLEKYLDGKLYTDEDSFEKYREVQKNNAEAIINVCNE